MLVHRLKILLLLLSPSFIWGILFILADNILQEISPLYLAILRYAPGTIVVGIIVYILEGKNAYKIDKDFIKVASLGCLSMLGFNILVWIGVSISNGILAAIFQPMAPLIGILISFIFFRQKYNLLTFVIILIAFLGVFLAASNGNMSFLSSSGSLGVILIFVGVTLSTFTGIFSQRFKNFSMLRFTVVTNGAAMILFCLMAVIGNYIGITPFPSVENILNVKWEILYMSIFAGSLPLFLWYKGFEIIGAVNGMLITNLVPVITLTGSLVLGYTVGKFEVIGCLVVIMAMMLHYINVKRTTPALQYDE